jgi:hypothetical protein
MQTNTQFQAIEGMLRPQTGIISVKVALLAERGVIEYDPALWNPEKLASVRPLTLFLPIIHAHTWYRKSRISDSTRPSSLL